MKREDAKFYGTIVIICSIILGIGGTVSYRYQHNWNETGTISWVGGKVYDDTQTKFVTPFAVTVPVHGTFNFTETGTGALCGNASYASGLPISKGTVVELIKLQCGGYDLVVDP